MQQKGLLAILYLEFRYRAMDVGDPFCFILNLHDGTALSRACPKTTLETQVSLYSMKDSVKTSKR